MLSEDLDKKQATIAIATIRFVEYVHDFYGHGGLYDMGATREQIGNATKDLLRQHGVNICFDSVDRERVRDILISKYSLVFPTP